MDLLNRATLTGNTLLLKSAKPLKCTFCDFKKQILEDQVFKNLLK